MPTREWDTVPEVRLAKFPVGKTRLIYRKKSKGTALGGPIGKWRDAGTIWLPKGGLFLVGHQIRIGSGLWAKVRFERLGWGSGQNSKGIDVTGLHPYLPPPDGRVFSDSFLWSISGGGPLRCRVKVLETAPGEQDPSREVPLITSIFKAKRIA